VQSMCRKKSRVDAISRKFVRLIEIQAKVNQGVKAKVTGRRHPVTRPRYSASSNSKGFIQGWTAQYIMGCLNRSCIVEILTFALFLTSSILRTIKTSHLEELQLIFSLIPKSISEQCKPVSLQLLIRIVRRSTARVHASDIFTFSLFPLAQIKWKRADSCST
jgi:hypothetical protein